MSFLFLLSAIIKEEVIFFWTVMVTQSRKIKLKMLSKIKYAGFLVNL